MTVRAGWVVGLGTAAAAAVGSLGSRPDDEWYARLDKPRWQPPRAAFPAVWTALYAGMGVAATRALDRTRGPQRRRLAAAYGANLVLNSVWPWAFFRTRRPACGLAGVVVLEVSTLDLACRMGQADRTAGVLLAPYALWNAFAAALNADIARRNRAAA